MTTPSELYSKLNQGNPADQVDSSGRYPASMTGSQLTYTQFYPEIMQGLEAKKQYIQQMGQYGLPPRNINLADKPIYEEVNKISPAEQVQIRQQYYAQPPQEYYQTNESEYSPLNKKKTLLESLYPQVQA